MQAHLLLIFSLMWAKSLAQGTLPTATLEPALTILAIGQDATFSCATTDTNSVTWMHDNTVITVDANHVISASDQLFELMVIDFSSDLTGNYTCVATNDAGSVSSRTAVLELAVHEVDFYSEEVDQPHVVTIIAGEPAAINCGSYTSIPASDLGWLVQFGNNFIPISLSNEGATIGLNQSMYILDPSTNIDGDIFRCALANTLTESLTTGYVQVNVQASSSPLTDPFMLSPPQDVTTWVGQTVSFECIPGGSGATGMTATWTGPVSGRISPDTFRLSISDIDAASAGTYSCTIEGIGSFEASLSLIDAPVLDTILHTTHDLTYGDPLTLTCSTSTTPQSTYWEWFHNGNRLTAEVGPSFTVESTTLDNAGSYQCFAYNSAGYSQSATLLQVNTIDAEITVDLPPTQVAFREKPFTMSCFASGAPPPTYSWFKASTPLETGGSFDVDEDGVLVIRSVDGSSEGMYECRASNSLPDGTFIGSDNSQTMLSTISPTKINQEQGPEFSVQFGLDTILNCGVTHDEDASVQFSWTKDGQPLVVGTERMILLNSYSGDIQIKAVQYEDAGDYQCIVSTVYNGLNAPVVLSIVTDVDVTATPVAPVIIPHSLNSTSPTSFHIEWIFRGASTFVNNYIIEVQSVLDADAPWIPLETRSVSAITSADISSEILEAFTLYNVRVVAIYNDGNRVPSDVDTVRTGSDVPADSPSEVMGVAPNNMALSISWEPPAIPRGEILYYIIMYKMVDEAVEDKGPVSVNTGSNDTGYVITGLPEFKKFEVQVAAATSAGVGPYSSPITVHTVETGFVEEPDSESFVNTIGFIMLIVSLGLLGIVCLVVLALVARHKLCPSKKKAAGKYHIRHSGYFGKGSSAVIGLEGINVVDLSEDAIASYGDRNKRAFCSTSPSGSRSGSRLGPLELEAGASSSYVGAATPQLSIGSGVRLNMNSAPSYIDPPSFEETVMNAGKRTHSAASTYNRDFDIPMRDLEDAVRDLQDIESKAPLTGMFNNNLSSEYTYEDSEVSTIEKNPIDTNSDDLDTLSEHTQYSHLAGAYPTSAKSTGTEATFHHQLNLPLSASSSAGVPMTFGEIVDNRLLRQQSPEEMLQVNYATNV